MHQIYICLTQLNGNVIPLYNKLEPKFMKFFQTINPWSIEVTHKYMESYLTLMEFTFEKNTVTTHIIAHLHYTLIPYKYYSNQVVFNR